MKPLWIGLLLLGLPTAAGTRVLPEGVEEVLLAPRGDAGYRDEEAVVDDLAALGDEAIPMLFLCITGEVFESLPAEIVGNGKAFAVPPDRVIPVCQAALARYPARSVLGHMTLRVRQGKDEAVWAATARLLGDLGSAHGVDLWLELADGLLQPETSDAVLGRPMQGALRSMLERDAATVAQLERRLADMDYLRLNLVVQSLVRARRGDAAPLLIGLTRTDQDHLAQWLEALGSVAGDRPWEVPGGVETVRDTLSRHLQRGSAEVRRTAVLATAGVLDAGLASTLVPLVDGGDPEVAAAARWSLARAAGADHGADPQAWSQWVAAEARWMEFELEEVLARVASDDPVDRIQALRELPAHRLARLRIGAALGELLPGLPPEAFRMAVEVLRGLDARTATPALVGALSSADPRGRAAITAALRDFTSLELPPEREPWDQALRRR